MRVSRALCLRHEAPELCRAFTRQDLHLCITPSIFSSSGSAPRNARCRLLDLLEDVREAAHGRGRVADSRAARLCLGLGCWLFCRWRASVPWPANRIGSKLTAFQRQAGQMILRKIPLVERRLCGCAKHDGAAVVAGEFAETMLCSLRQREVRAANRLSKNWTFVVTTTGAAQSSG